MFHPRRPSAAMAVAIAALVVALGGTAVAATKVIITKSSQVKNGSLRGVDLKNGSVGANKLTAAAVASLRGRDGAPGVPGLVGAQGEPGVQGPAGPAGPAGPLLDTLPSGRTQAGVFSLRWRQSTPATVDTGVAAVTYQLPLAASMPFANVHILDVDLGDTDASCPGTPAAPAAAAGHLCIWLTNRTPGPSVGVSSPQDPSNASGVGTLGFSMLMSTSSDGAYNLVGVWAVTAP